MDIIEKKTRSANNPFRRNSYLTSIYKKSKESIWYIRNIIIRTIMHIFVRCERLLFDPINLKMIK